MESVHFDNFRGSLGRKCGPFWAKVEGGAGFNSLEHFGGVHLSVATPHPRTILNSMSWEFAGPWLGGGDRQMHSP